MFQIVVYFLLTGRSM